MRASFILSAQHGQNLTISRLYGILIRIIEKRYYYSMQIKER